MPYSVIDLFAGPGGLGEGFSRFGEMQKFRVALSVEMDEAAHKTLLLRSLFRTARRENDIDILNKYYTWCNDRDAVSPLDSDSKIFRKASSEALKATLGTKDGNAAVDEALGKLKLKEENTVLIGGPPCQAYSLVGRSRNMGINDYTPEDDNRHFLYREYLRIVSKIRPAVFIFENVQGILTSNVGGKGIFKEILKDLAAPGKATGGDQSLNYSILPLTAKDNILQLIDEEFLSPEDYIIRAEQFGIPQARHRVILMGVRKEISNRTKIFLKQKKPICPEEVLHDLPDLRSKLSRGDTAEAWNKTIIEGVQNLISEIQRSKIQLSENQEIAKALGNALKTLDPSLSTGGLRHPRDLRRRPFKLDGNWYFDENLKVHLNHESRSHMNSDLIRYFYASVFTRLYNRTPKGHQDFPYDILKPMHNNWESGNFSDRFRVQVPNKPSSTITSHMAKDGHYYIHWDPSQCRSFTVREAARLQTFPDNYFFQGNRSQQYHQVGNAVPPYLAYQIAEIVATILI